MTTWDILKKTRAAWPSIRNRDAEGKNDLLRGMADSLMACTPAILAENCRDMEEARGTISDVMLDRLYLDEKRLADQQRKHEDTVKELKKDCFDTPKLREWCFAQDNGANPQMKHARFYADNFDTMLSENIGYLLWGSVGTGKSFFAACIANALMEKEIPVRMTNFAAVLNDLSGSFEGRNAYIARLCHYPLLILDDFGMERGTEYGLEQVYNVIDSRYRSGKPLIVTTNLSLDELQHPQDTPHARIYDRLLEMCAPILFTGTNFRRQTAQSKLDKLKTIIKEKECL